MKKVVCIKSPQGIVNGCTVPEVGRIYTVINTVTHDYWRDSIRNPKKGIFYKLAEKSDWHHSDLFIDLIEDQQDETTFERNYNKELC